MFYCFNTNACYIYQQRGIFWTFVCRSQSRPQNPRCPAEIGERGLWERDCAGLCIRRTLIACLFLCEPSLVAKDYKLNLRFLPKHSRMFTSGFTYAWVQKISILAPQKGLEIPRRRGVSMTQKFKAIIKKRLDAEDHATKNKTT